MHRGFFGKFVQQFHHAREFVRALIQGVLVQFAMVNRICNDRQIGRGNKQFLAKLAGQFRHCLSIRRRVRFTISVAVLVPTCSVGDAAGGLTDGSRGDLAVGTGLVENFDASFRFNPGEFASLGLSFRPLVHREGFRSGSGFDDAMRIAARPIPTLAAIILEGRVGGTIQPSIADFSQSQSDFHKRLASALDRGFELFEAAAVSGRLELLSLHEGANFIR